MAKIPVCVVSFHPLVFPTVRTALAAPDFEVVEERVSPEGRARERGVPPPSASVYVVEGHLRATLTEAEISRVKSVSASSRVLVIGESFEDANAFSFLRMGAKGLLTFNQVTDQLPRAIRAVVDGGFWVPRLLLARFVEAAATASARNRAEPGDFASLTPRERQVLDGILDNLSSKEIATRLRISERGVKFHISNLLAKNRVRRRSDLVLLFLNSSKSSEEDSGAAGEESPAPDTTGPSAPRSE